MARATSTEIILYRTEDGQSELQLRAEDGTVWLTQLEIAELFATAKQNVSLHIKNVLDEGERSRLEAEVTADARYLEDLERTAKLLERSASKVGPRTQGTLGGRQKGKAGR